MTTNNTVAWDEVKNRLWNIDEIVTTNPPISGQKRALVNDLVVDWNIGLYRVSAVEELTNIATLELKSKFSESTLLDPSNGSIISALSMYMPNSATRVMVDKTVNPYTVTTDLRYLTKGVEAVEMRAFYGTDISDSGEVISAKYNGSGDIVSDLIPLIEVNPGEPRVKRPAIFETTKNLKNDDIITYVFYDAVGRKAGTQPFLVSESGAIFDYNSGQSPIVGIELRGDLIDKTDTKLINNPLNSPFQTALLEAWLSYSDGSEVRVPIDGNKCRLEGISRFNTSEIGTPKEVVLIYNCDPGEPAVDTGGTTQRFKREIYRLANIAVDTSFSLKVFVIPEYINNTTGYNYRYFLTSLDGDVDAEITEFVNARILSGDTVPGNNHGNAMDVTVGVNMDTVLPGAYPGHYHSQAYELTTQVPGTVGFEPWTINYLNANNQIYRANAVAHCTNFGNGAINIGMDFGNISTFLGDLYLNIHPLYDSSLLVSPETPTHAVLIYKGAEIEINVSTDWNQDIELPVGWPDFVNYDTLIIKWIVRDGSNDYVKGYTPMLLRTDL